VADSSLRWDLGRKALIYAHCGVRELWVVDAVRRLVHVHRDVGLDGYASIREFGETTRIDAASVPGLSLTISELDAV
jgi:Uma2 family endonuclease